MPRPHDGPRSVADALRAAGRLLRDRPAAVLPAYLLALGVTAATQVPVVVAIAGTAAILAATGRLEPLVRALGEVMTAARESGSAGGGPAAGMAGDLPPGVGDAVTAAATPAVIATVALGGVGAVVVSVLARAVASAATYGTVWAALDGRPPLVSGVETIGRWRTFVGVAVVRAALVLLAVGLPLAVVAGVASRSGWTASAGSPAGEITTATGALAIFVGVAVVGIGGLVAALVWFLLAFAESAAVVDERGALGAVRGSVGFVRAHPARAVAFALVAVGGYVGVGIAVTVANAAGAGRLGGLFLPLVVVPLLEAGATALYAGVGVPAPVERPAVRTRLRRALADGWGELVAFLRGHPVTVLAGLGILAGGVVVGYATTAPYGVAVPPPADVAGVFGSVAVGPFLTIAVNNWLVSAGIAFGGLALGIPAASGLAFNGLLVGALAGVFDRAAFLALVAPHGVLELPVIAVAGGLGLHLGVVGWRGLRGRASAATVADEFERAAHVLVGIAILLVVAAAIEAFLTPRIAAAVLGG
ncbi:stage II sporulation protein M [Halobaculum sp. CBA1158]|uniref:stage II sporulation protein M n=1 Tax=Halobaculum sp. CBA1158 TaxID=2904243 RepID=UPI001F1C21D8|nr:stage II sporulation protein M [Halobaculum sp. CBA1158]UIO99809.1 stage II sporulation protein M [Halobaculum sp. CBA1158]